MALLLILVAVIFGGFALLGVVSDHLLPRLVPALADDADCGAPRPRRGAPRPPGRVAPPRRPAAQGRPPAHPARPQEFALSG